MSLNMDLNSQTLFYYALNITETSNAEYNA